MNLVAKHICTHGSYNRWAACLVQVLEPLSTPAVDHHLYGPLQIMIPAGTWDVGRILGTVLGSQRTGRRVPRKSAIRMKHRHILLQWLCQGRGRKFPYLPRDPYPCARKCRIFFGVL